MDIESYPDRPGCVRCDDETPPRISGFNRNPILDPSVAVNEKGGKQSAVDERMDLLPPYALLCIADILRSGAEKYGEDNWRLLKLSDHINHAIRHLFLFLAGDGDENHLGNAGCRILFALDTAIIEQVREEAKETS